ncbi:MAG: hypothetical protein R3C46_16625 [Hyphomonadaceae bacterium]
MKTILPAIITAAALAGAASAQTAPSRSLASVKPVAASAATCATGLIEIAPVSFDTAGRPMAWVVVYRVDGEVVASERVTPREIEDLHQTPCKADAWRAQRLAG